MVIGNEMAKKNALDVASVKGFVLLYAGHVLDLLLTFYAVSILGATELNPWIPFDPVKMAFLKLFIVSVAYVFAIALKNITQGKVAYLLFTHLGWSLTAWNLMQLALPTLFQHVNLGAWNFVLGLLILAWFVSAINWILIKLERRFLIKEIKK